MTGRVDVRCGVKGCNTLLKSLEQPATWEGSARVWSCPRHGGFRGHIFDTARRRAAQGLEPRPEVILHLIPWRDLRGKFSDSVTRGKPEDHYVTPD